jgi:hypothetical protein
MPRVVERHENGSILANVAGSFRRRMPRRSYVAAGYGNSPIVLAATAVARGDMYHIDAVVTVCCGVPLLRICRAVGRRADDNSDQAER